MTDESPMTASSAHISDHRMATAWAKLDDHARDILARRAAVQPSMSLARPTSCLENGSGESSARQRTLADAFWPEWCSRLISQAAAEVAIAAEGLKGIPTTGAPEGRRTLLASWRSTSLNSLGRSARRSMERLADQP